MCFFSIIVPVFNVAPYLRDCLDSILAQTFSAWEAICVDDGSTDGSSAILDEYAAKDDRFKIIHQENKGSGATRNIGLAAASGFWVVFLDGDDLLKPSALKCIYETANETGNPDLIRFSYVQFQHGNPEWHVEDGTNSYDLDISHTIAMNHFYMYMWEVAYRKDVTEGVRFPCYKRGQDRVFINAVQLYRANRMICIGEVLYGYRIRPGSSVHSVPSTQVLLDEMDHRLDIIRMIDESSKSVVYAGNPWLEDYFTRKFPLIAGQRKSDRCKLIAAWRERMQSLRSAKGFSRQGAFLVHLASRRTTFPLAWLRCYWVPRIRQSLRYRIALVRRCLFERRKRR